MVSDALAISVALCSAIAVALIAFAPAVMSALAPGMSSEMLGHAVDYVRIRAVGLPFALAYSVMQVCALPYSVISRPVSQNSWHCLV